MARGQSDYVRTPDETRKELPGNDRQREGV